MVRLSRYVTWVSIHPFASVRATTPKYQQEGLEPAGLQELEFVEEEADASNGESEQVQSDRQRRGAGDENGDDDEESIFFSYS